MINNIVLSISLAFTFLLAEQLFRISNPLLSFNLDLHKVIVQFAISFVLFLLVSKKAIKIILVFILFFMYMQFLHFNYYGTWIFPLEYILFFTKFTEIIDTFITVLDITIVPTMIMLVTSIIVFYLFSKMSENRLKIPYLGVVLVLFLIFIPARVFVKDTSKKGARPNVEVSTVVNTVETLGYLFGRILPQKISGKNFLTKETIPSPKVVENNPDINIVVIMGESLTHSKMSLFGSPEKTTPFLDELAEDKNFFSQIAFTSGVVTDVALPSFFNILYEPDSTPQILTTNTCLFRMAKENGFSTYFYSAQSQIGLAYIKSYMCLSSIDHYLDGTDETMEMKQNAYDEILVDRLENVNFDTSNFIVLHQIGSHSPYGLRYPKEFEKFKINQDDKYDRNGYLNSILYTDYVLSKIIEKLREKTNKPTYVFFTSDHGEGIGNHRGHGNLKLPSNYEVPFFMYTLNTPNTIKDKIEKNKYTSHYEIAKYIATLLGYDVSLLQQKENKYVVCGKDICGVAGYLELYVEQNKVIKKSFR